MEFITGSAGRSEDIAALFEDTFTASEGAEEGALIGVLARDLLSSTAPEDLFVFSAVEAGALVGSVMFSRMTFAGDERVVFLLSPMAVRTDQQGRGVGQALIRFGLDALLQAGVDVAVTYGDPAFYGKVGFQQVSTDRVATPLALSHPHGWLAQSLDGDALAPLTGPSTCVTALSNPDYW